MATVRTAFAASRRGLARPAIFGSFDGAASLIGVTIYLLLSHHPALIFPVAVSGAISSAVSMGGGEWLSDSLNGLTASTVMAIATFTGAILPAVPFAFLTGPAAVAECGIICVCIAVAVSALRPERSLPLALAETLGILIVVVAVVVACSLILPGGAT